MGTSSLLYIYYAFHVVALFKHQKGSHLHEDENLPIRSLWTDRCEVISGSGSTL